MISILRAGLKRRNSGDVLADDEGVDVVGAVASEHLRAMRKFGG